MDIKNDSHKFSLKEFGQILKAARNRQGILQDVLADRLDISKRTLLEIEAGRSDVSVNLAFLAAKELNISIYSLLGIPEASIVNSFNSIQQEANAQQGIHPTHISVDRDWLVETNKRFTFLEDQIKRKDEIIDSIIMLKK
jgi:transcriptional regulator with XRE-family HTH domain